MRKVLGSLIALTCVLLFGPTLAKLHAAPAADDGTVAAAAPSPLPGCTVADVEAGVAACDPQGPEVGSGDDVDTADCSVEGECQGTSTGNPEGEGAFDAGGDDASPDHG